MTLKLVSDSFEEFWKVYPRKQGKLLARAAFQRVTDGGKDILVDGMRVKLEATPEALIRAAKAFRYQMNIIEEREDQHIPHASTWLNQARWEDEEEGMADKMDAILRRMR